MGRLGGAAVVQNGFCGAERAPEAGGGGANARGIARRGGAIPRATLTCNALATAHLFTGTRAQAVHE